ncbi:general stress protein [Aquibacillus halophilus]|uniref:General stress protein n=1 Tax=Aquibacillus halophilus TaxID=930132 RepID=A0A6A8DJ21_9BACI|nr:pyridoxamine 5'-phosphate oxidase family protein [Aquibacillus halophilus]MRH43751.1 general stress protein [Aquibacillus halophilus]
MQQSEIKKVAEQILSKNKIGTLSTVRKDKPYSRYMTFFNENFTLYSATDKRTHKVEDLKTNNNVHILIGYNLEGLTDSYLEIEGKAEVTDSTELKHKLWNDDLKPWFDGVDDPSYTVLKINPEEIRLMNTNSNEAQLLEL